jgi:hypothetical protein
VRTNDQDPKDVDAKLSAESRRLLSEMNALLERGRLLLRDRQRAMAASEKLQATPGTLGAVLYARPSHAAELERDWVSLVRSIAAGDRPALHALGERTHRLVSTLILRLAGDRQVERLTRDTFDDVRREAGRYDVESGTVLGWVMNLAQARVAAGPRGLAVSGLEPVLPPTQQWSEPPWEDVAPGISVKMFATDAERHRVSMQVRLIPGGEYPPHTHAGVEELHLLDGELWIDDRKLRPGDYNRAEPGTGDSRVWSETGCSCVLVTSTRDVLR